MAFSGFSGFYKATKMAGHSSKFEKEFLEAHNNYRKLHGAPPLQLTRELCQSAQEWADHMLSIKSLQHSDTDNGENLYYAWSSTPKEILGKEAVDSWYSEIKDYDFSNPGFMGNTGHFTQVVWKDSKEVGVGKATDGKTIYVVGQYKPAGNISNDGFFQKNVLPANSSGGQPKYNDPDSAPKKLADKNSLAARPLSMAEFETEALECHNAYRKLHGVPALSLSRELCQDAQQWANHLASLGTIQHSNSNYGENLYCKWSSNKADATGKDVVDYWYSEIKDYNFQTPGFQSNTGHFTQVVWKDSRNLGIGKTVNAKGMVIAVARYDPAGNITNPGYFEKNVRPRGAAAASNDTLPEGGKKMANPGGDNFAKDFLQACNERRAWHGARPLELNSQISRDAQSWAEHLVKLGTLKHSDTKLGENIWAQRGPPQATVSGAQTVEAWYKEVDNYDFSKAGHQERTGHFTQLVWRSSTEVGVGKASDGKGLIVIVAQFSPAGNITNRGYYERNVLPKGSKVTDEPVEKEMEKLQLTNQVVPIAAGQLQLFSSSLLDAHNRFRQQHGAGPLTCSSSLSRKAQQWAEALVGMRALKSSGMDYGENLWYRQGNSLTLPTGTEVAEAWYSENTNYNFSTPGFQSGSGNFTQMVWKSSLQIGIGLAQDGDGLFIVVAFFDPAGNITNQGYFEKNVQASATRGLSIKLS
ncbi:uncharacterized protein LOC120542095 isoform X1 [Polypterus senegalus]|uniref:uncharacterized protein LOC120542095 isoform X1 n=3 Tax=Polypterus senegalus TaxID=55291 RepID=UPI001964ECAB|nr:uncharacterized protein LOC120542095 isoform X1 [Polypterus senegalus]